MQSPDIEAIIKSLMNRRDAISVKAAKAIRHLQDQVAASYQLGWDAALRRAIEEVTK